MSKDSVCFSSQFVLTYCQGAMCLDKKLDPLFKQANVDLARINLKQNLSFEEMQRIDESLTQRYDTCHLALFKRSPPAIALRVTANALAQASVLKDAVQCLIEMMQAINSPILPSISVFQGQATIALKLTSYKLNDANADLHFVLALRLLKVLRIIRFLTNSPLPLTTLRLTNSPLSPVSAFVMSHNISAVFWSQKSNMLSFPANYLELPCNIREASCLSFLTNNSDIFAAPQPHKQDFVLRLRSWMYQELEDNNQLPNAKLAERVMNCNAKTLARRLTKEKTTFKELKKNVIDQKAKELLTETDSSVSHIAAQLGYSEDTSFCRAFRLQNAISPGEYRDMGLVSKVC